MRREDFTIESELDGVATLRVTFGGTPESLRERLDSDGVNRDATDFDVAYRHTPREGDGILGVTDRMTGEFIFEAAVSEATIETLVQHARADDSEDEPRYRLRIDPGDDDPMTVDKRTLLVYDADGSLIRKQSLIPGSVEI